MIIEIRKNEKMLNRHSREYIFKGVLNMFFVNWRNDKKYILIFF